MTDSKRPVLPHIELVPISMLKVDLNYQREWDEKRSRKIAREYDQIRYGLLCVSHRSDGSLWIVDGRHRFEAAKILGWDVVPCAIYPELWAEKEADLFARLTKERKGLSAVDRFRAQVFAGYPESVEIQAVVNDLGLVIDRQKHTPTTISAVVSLERIHRRWGKSHLRDTLSMSKEIWGGEDGSLQGAFLDGFARFYAAYGDDRFDSDVKSRLRLVSPSLLMRRASAIRGGGSQMGHLIDAQLRKIARIKGRPRKMLRPQ